MKLPKIPTALCGSLILSFSLSAETPDTSALPAVYLDDAVLAVDVDIAGVKASGFYQGLVSRGFIEEDELLAEEIAELFEGSDLSTDSLGRLVVNVAGLEIDPDLMDVDPANLRISGGLELTTAFSADEFNNWVQSYEYETGEELLIHERHGYTYYVSPEEFEDEPQFSGGLYDGAALSVMFFGDQASVEQSFDKAIAGRGELTASLAAARPIMLGDSNVSVLFTLSDEMREMISQGIQEDPMMGGMLRPLANLQTLGLGLDADESLGLTIAGQFPSEREASQMQNGLQMGLALAMGFAGEQLGETPAPLQKLEIKTEGPILRITTNITLEDVDKMVADLGAMFQF
ncbi:MAG: hypothetical protein LAT55_12740 [Opitutales bacterium]|nr:hypothetical protein [Opitutales bacterium]